MKILHIASLNSAKKNIGVVRQMQYEANVVNDLPTKWDVQLWAGDSLAAYDFICEYPSICKSRISKRRYFIGHLKKMSEIYDVILLRYLPCDPFLPLFRSAKAKIIFCHHTKETYSFRSISPGVKGLLFSFCEIIFGFLSLRKADGIVAVTPEILEYEKKRTIKLNVPGVVVPNGIDYTTFHACEDFRGGKVKVLFIASNFFSWHGLSNILKSLLNFKEKEKLELHLVGKIFEKDLCFIQKYGLEKTIFLHGYLLENQIKILISQMDVGLASFALGEARLTQACTLKVREYLAAGLPVYSGHIDSGLPSDFDFYRIGLPDISMIYNFAIEVRKTSRKHVRQMAKKYIAKVNIVYSLHDWILFHYKLDSDNDRK